MLNIEKNGKEITPNLFIDFDAGLLKTNKLAETFIEFNTIGKTDPVYVGNNFDNKTQYFAPVRGKQIKPDEGLNIKVNSVDEIDWKNYFEETLGIIRPSKEIYSREYLQDVSNYVENLKLRTLNSDYRPQILCMPNYYPITNIDNYETLKVPIVDGTKSTILVKSNKQYESSLRRIYDGFNSWNEEIKFVFNKVLILCADPRIFNPYSYVFETYFDEYEDMQIERGVYKPEGFEDDVDDWRTDGNMNGEKLAHARKGFFVVNGNYTKFLVVSPGNIVKMTSCYETIKTANGEEKVLMWYVDNSNSFSRIDGKIEVKGHNAYDVTNKVLKFCNYGTTATFGVEKFTRIYEDVSYDDEYNYVYVSNSLEKAYRMCESFYVNEIKYFLITINLYSAVKQNWEDSIESVDTQVFKYVVD